MKLLLIAVILFTHLVKSDMYAWPDCDFELNVPCELSSNRGLQVSSGNMATFRSHLVNNFSGSNCFELNITRNAAESSTEWLFVQVGINYKKNVTYFNKSKSITL